MSFTYITSQRGPLKLAIVCLITAVLYFLAYGFWGICDTDQGFITGLAWRIVQGEIPYRDFIYVRPPLSLYLHSLPMLLLPDQYVMIGERFLFYLFMAASVFVATRTLQHYFDFTKIGISPEIFAAMAFICSVHNYPPMAWHTVDGILFATMGMNRLVRGTKAIGYYTGLILLLATALSKQAFYPLLVGGPVLLFIVQDTQLAWKATAGFLMTFMVGVGTLLVLDMDWVMLFIAQTTGVTPFADVLEIGVIKFLKPFLIILLPLIIAWRAQVVYDWKYLPLMIFGLVFFGLLGLHVFKALETGEYVGPSYGFSQAFFLLAVGISVKGFWINPKAYSVLLGLLAISWCAGLSWGYANQMLFFTPILFGFIYTLYEELDFAVPRYFYGITCVLLVWVFATLYQYPYRDAPREELIYTPADIFPRLTGLRTGKKNYEKNQRLKHYVDNYGPDYVVLPAFPLAHFLTESINPIGVDWAHNAEMDFNRNSILILKQLEENVSYALVEKDKEEEVLLPDRYGSKLTTYVKNRWDLIEEDTYFQVFRRPGANKQPSRFTPPTSDLSLAIPSPHLVR